MYPVGTFRNLLKNMHLTSPVRKAELRPNLKFEVAASDGNEF